MMHPSKTAIYLDANASETLRPEAKSAILAALEYTGNPSSIHGHGRAARQLLEASRVTIASSVGCAPSDLIFCSGGTESNAMAIAGLSPGRRLLIGATEHDAVRAAAPDAAVLPVTNGGALELDALDQALRGGPPALVCLMLANNETGVLHPVAEAAAICRAHGALLHVDAVQAAGRIAVDRAALGADSLALSAHKQGGPKGVGALALAPGLHLAPLIAGGGQERGRRGGTPALPAIAGFAAAAAAPPASLAPLRDRLEQAAVSAGAVVCGSGPRLPNTTSLALPGVRAETQVIALDLAGLSVSAGAACSSGKVTESYVLAAMGLGAMAASAIRVSLPWNASETDIDGFIEAYARNRQAPVASRRGVSNTLIYLDNQATTACDPRVLEAMWPWFADFPGNPHSTEHQAGRAAAAAVEQARAEVAALIGAAPSEIIFTSGATEANNLAIKGAARFAGPAERPRIVTTATEHKCVLESVASLAAEGFEPVILPVEPSGALAPARLAAALAVPTLLVSVLAAHNETGFVQDIAGLAAIARQAGARLHTDLAQAAGKLPIDVHAQGIDAASISAHKLHGPKGIGALYVRRHPRLRLAPLFSGGGQERGLRSGTLATPLIVGFGEACRIAASGMAAEQARIAGLRDRMLAALRARIPGLALNGGLEHRLAGNLSLRFPGIRATRLIDVCPALAVSTGSACTSAEIAPSHVLTAIGLTPAEAAATLRIGIGRFTSAADIDNAVNLLAGAYATLLATAEV